MSKARVHAVDVSTILSDASILERVFSFLPGHWLYLGGICRAWMQNYKLLLACKILTVGCDKPFKRVACVWHTTFMNAAFQSPSRLRLAVARGLLLNPPDDGFGDCWEPSPLSKLQYSAGLHADKAVLSLAEELGMPLGPEVVNGAAASGRVSMLRHLARERHCALPRNIGYSAAHSGNIDMLKYVVKHRRKFTPYACSNAARVGRLPALQYILSTLQCTCDEQPYGPDERCDLCEWITDSSIYDAATGGTIEMLQWLQQQYPHATADNALDAAVSAGQTAMCAYLHSQQPDDYPLSEDACRSAAFRGQVETLDWLRQHGYPWSGEGLRRSAARGGSIASMQYLQQQGIVSTAAQLTDMLLRAGANNCLQAAKWLRQQGADWPPVLNCGVDMEWKYHVLAWARAEGCTAPSGGNYSDHDYSGNGSSSESDTDSGNEGANDDNEDEH
jgi:hypothetical protein